MSTAQSVIENTVIDILAHTGPCTMDEMVKALPAYDWSDVFFAVDHMSRDGRLVIQRPSSSTYELSLAGSCRGHRSYRAGASPVRFCVGCGYLCDEIDPKNGLSPWIDAHSYLKKYRLTWIELDRTEGFCPACACVQACGTGRVSPKTAAPDWSGRPQGTAHPQGERIS